MMTLFDSYYYRMARTFMKRDGLTAARAVTSLAFLQGMLVLVLGMVCFKPYFPRQVTAPYAKVFGWVGAVIIVAFTVHNFLRYDYQGAKYGELATRWQDETRPQRRWRGLAVFASVPVALALNFLLMSLF